MTRPCLTDELPKIISRLKRGQTLQQIADHYGCTRAAVSTCVRKHAPQYSVSEMRAAANRREHEAAEAKRRAYIMERYGRETWRIASKFEANIARIFKQKKNNTCMNSKKDRRNIEWTIKPSDIDWPLDCPILGIRLDYNAKSVQENSPSFDRLDPSLGYVPGNVHIISWRANRIKNDGTAKEHAAIAAYMKKMGAN